MALSIPFRSSFTNRLAISDGDSLLRPKLVLRANAQARYLPSAHKQFIFFTAALLGIFSAGAARSSAQLTVTAPADGESTVTINSATPLAGTDHILLYSNTGAIAGANCSATAADVVTLKAGVPTTVAANSTSIVLVADKAFTEGSPLCAALTGNPANNSTVVLVGGPSTPPGFDWGLVRAYFTAGSLMSQEHNQFSHQDLFLAFRLEKTYLMSKKRSDGTYEPHLNTFFETRLTALPVAVQSCTPNATTTPPTVCSSSTSSSGAAASTTTSQTFLNSQKTARLQFGTFMPVYFKHWTVDSKKGNASVPVQYALFAAPIVKVGFDTALNGLNQTQQGSSTSSQVQPIGTSSQFYKFYDFGFRLGHDQLKTASGSAPEPLSYLDVSWGRFSNLASLLCPLAQYQGNNSCAAASGSLPWHRDVRLRVEGILEVPGTKGFSVGFGTNVSFFQHQVASATVPVHIHPADDLRFLFAYKFDISKIAAKLAPQNF